jgi:hypothetical protein
VAKAEIRLKRVNKIVMVVWVSGAALAVSHLRYLAGSDLHPAGFWSFTGFLMACYSLPFFALTQIHVPENRSPQRYLTLALFASIFAVSLLIPARRFLPGYHPEALEGLAYLFIPIFECGLIVLFIVIRTAIARLNPKR